MTTRIQRFQFDNCLTILWISLLQQGADLLHTEVEGLQTIVVVPTFFCLLVPCSRINTRLCIVSQSVIYMHTPARVGQSLSASSVCALYQHIHATLSSILGGVALTKNCNSERFRHPFYFLGTLRLKSTRQRTLELTVSEEYVGRAGIYIRHVTKIRCS